MFSTEDMSELDELPFKISNEQLLAALPKTKQRIPKFPVDAYRGVCKNPYLIFFQSFNFLI